MPDQEQNVDLHFPSGGLNVVSAFMRQPNRPIPPNNLYVRTCPIGQNVRSYDVLEDRIRGGSRGGLSKPTNLPNDRVAGTPWVVQDLRLIATTSVDAESSLTVGLLGYYKLEGNFNDSSGHGRHLQDDAPPAATYNTGKLGQGLYTGAGFRTPLGGLSAQAISLSAWFYATTTSGAGGGTGHGRGDEVGDAFRIAYRSNGTNGKVVVRNRTGVDIIDPGFVLALSQWHHAAMTYNGSTVKLFLNGAEVGSTSYTLTNGWQNLTFGIRCDGADFSSPLDEVGVWSRVLTNDEITQLYNAGAGLDLVNSPGGSVQLSQSGRIVTLVAVSQGQVKVASPGDTSWTTPTNETGETPPLNYTGIMTSAVNNQKLFFADGINYIYYDPSDNKLKLWTPTAGQLPVDEDTNYARLICTWRGRTVLSGLLKEPQNWFMSRVSDPFDWDYAPESPGPDQAVAGNASPLGLIGDVVTALIPHSDDVLIVGGDHSIYAIRGDPMLGGQIDLVSDAIGIAFGEAWCKDPYGTIYFISNRCGVYSMIPGSLPVRISQAIEPLLQELNMGRNIFRMIWNDREQGFHLFVTWADEPKATTHFFWEQRTGAWWTDVFANHYHNPLCCVTFDGNEPGDRAVLIGCWDGYVRQIDHDAEDDDGEPIESEVWIGPLTTKDFDEILLKDLQAILGETSGTVNYAVHVGSTAEAALESKAVAVGTWKPGRNLVSQVRRAGHAIYVKLRSQERWAMEAIRARIATAGSVRRRA